MQIKSFMLQKAFLFIFSMTLICNAAEQNMDNHLVIITTSYKNAKVYEKNLDSVFAQKADNWRMIYVDDNSPDNTGELVEQYVKKHNFQHKIKVVRNKKRVGALENIVTAVHSCRNDEIIVSLDGDDWFEHEHVLERLNLLYSQQDIWMTYGTFRFASNGKDAGWWLHDYPESIKSNRSFREYNAILPSHLRTFYAGLFKKINLDDLKHNGNFFEMAWDVAFMIPMIEMAAKHYLYIKEVLYVYNDLSEINDNKVDSDKQQYLDKVIRQKPKYPILEQRPF